MRTAIFPGTFDPFTKGHADIVSRGLEMFDKIIIAIGVNEQKVPYQSLDDRIAAIRKVYADEKRIDVCTYNCLTTDLARQYGAEFILRGVRDIKDFEYERNIADINHQLTGIETVVLFSRPQLAAISSSLVRELQHFGKDITEFLPD